MLHLRIDENGVIRRRWDDAARVYTEWNAQGVQIEQRPYTLEENARADALAIYLVEETNRQAIETALSASLVELQTIVDTPNNQVGAAAVKTLARVLRRVIRLLIRRLDGSG